jgi:hypothetical protein
MKKLMISFSQQQLETLANAYRGFLKTMSSKETALSATLRQFNDTKNLTETGKEAARNALGDQIKALIKIQDKKKETEILFSNSEGPKNNKVHPFSSIEKGLPGEMETDKEIKLHPEIILKEGEIKYISHEAFKDELAKKHEEELEARLGLTEKARRKQAGINIPKMR